MDERTRRRTAGGLVAALLLAWPPLFLPAGAMAHDESTMSRAEGRALAEKLLSALDDPRRERELRRGAASPGDLVRRLGQQPEVRQLIHLRLFAAETVLAALAREARRPGAEREVFACALVHVLDQARFRGALPTLLGLLASWPEGPYLPDVATQAIKSLTAQDGQDLGDMRFTAEERRAAAVEARAYLARRASEVLELVAAQAAGHAWLGASSPATFYEILALDPLVVELAHLCSVAGERLAARLRRPGSGLAKDYELAALAFAVERGGCKRAVPALIDLLAGDTGDFLFAPHLATHALIVLTGQPDPNPRALFYSEEAMARVVRKARAGPAGGGGPPGP